MGEIVTLHRADDRVKGVQLARNFGHQYALFAGLSHARGDAIISMDADLQHPPALIPVLVERWREGYKIVNTVRLDPKSLSRFKRITSALYYALLSKLSGVSMRRGMSDCRLLDRQVVDELMSFGEAGLFLRGLVMWMGYPMTWVPFECRDRLVRDEIHPQEDGPVRARWRHFLLGDPPPNRHSHRRADESVGIRRARRTRW